MARKEKIIPAWRQEKRKCAVCGRAFYPRQSVQKYCSPECCRYANRHGGRAFSGPPMISDPNKPAIRQFKCKHCGEEVRVTETNDLRTKFCSQRCENLYWKHSKRVKRGKKETRSFRCRNCGKLVVITDSHDRRSVFCSKECSVDWHTHKKKRTDGIRSWLETGTRSNSYAQTAAQNRRAGWAAARSADSGILWKNTGSVR